MGQWVQVDVRIDGLSSILVNHNRLAGLALATLLPLISSCVMLTVEPRALLLQPDGAIRVQRLPCNVSGSPTPDPPLADRGAALDPNAIRILTWNIHKEGDAGWQRDLGAFVKNHDIVLLQEVVLQDSLRDVIEAAGLRWVMASSFLYRGDDIGVLTAARVAPQASCTERVVEPLIRLPKSAAISWFRIGGTSLTLAVVNVHAINFSLSLETYRAQFAALGDALVAHQGPIVFAGDLNTWTDARGEAVAELAARLRLTEIPFAEDKRTLFFGKQLDHLFIRGLEVVDTAAIPVTSSDHNPVAATLRIPGNAR
jgi:endonuclease/exonuclease/phosphatase (EEP) superfamily protein YafD